MKTSHFLLEAPIQGNAIIVEIERPTNTEVVSDTEGHAYTLYRVGRWEARNVVSGLGRGIVVTVLHDERSRVRVEAVTRES